ncbi:aspartyl protease family protein [Mesonia mobilis]|uniref:PDZ domain-containing protein n=1 Tax=Mesonia mobilis TaxID=369791 RepID=A0ABQ3C3P9_9FLAO|nr:aspartyl protease family protein [Mesonia mobilis]MBQ0739611.1 aspartyl protease family protein [Aquimarina celericrescens]GGZ65928.1 hypothetical protein GCM10008088_28770 [Mesonia mobilis]
MKRIFKIISITILILLSVSVFAIFTQYRNYKKLETVKFNNSFVKDTIPFYYSNSGHILIDVSIQGSKKTYPFILDSGASNMVFNPNINKFNFESNGYAIGKGASGNYFLSKIKKINSINIRSLKLKNFNAQEINHNFDCMQNIYGIIGLGLMHNFNWQIDFKNKIIIVTKTLENLNLGNHKIELKLKENQFSHHLELPIKLASKASSTKVKIDLGNNGNLSIEESEMYRDSLNLRFKKIIGTQLSGLGQKEFSMSKEKKYLSDTLILNSNFEILNFSFSTNPNSLNLLGLGFFKKFKTTVSWPNKLLILEPYDQQSNFVDKTFGFDISYDKNGDIIINSIIENTPATQNKLILNSKIISINNIKNNLCVLKDILKKNDSVSLKLLSNNKIKEYKLEKKPLFE